MRESSCSPTRQGAHLFLQQYIFTLLLLFYGYGLTLHQVTKQNTKKAAQMQ